MPDLEQDVDLLGCGGPAGVVGLFEQEEVIKPGVIDFGGGELVDTISDQFDPFRVIEPFAPL